MNAMAAPAPWHAETVCLLTGFLVLGVLAAGVIVLVLWRTRMEIANQVADETRHKERVIAGSERQGFHESYFCFSCLAR